MADDAKEEEKGFNINPIYVLGVLFFPAIIIKWGFFSLLKNFKLQISFIAIIATIITAVDLIAAFIAFNVYDSFISKNAIITFYIIICVFVGVWAGTFKAYKTLKHLDRNPHLLKKSGTWHYNLELKKTPWESKKIKKRIEALQNGTLVTEDRAPLGLDESSGKMEVVYRYDEEAIKHTLIVGTSGSGKTITLLSLMRKNIVMNQPVFIIDMKRSSDLASKIADWTDKFGGNFYHFVNGSPEDYDIKKSKGQVFYDPFIDSDITSRVDMMLNLREWAAGQEHFKTNTQQVLQVVYNVLNAAQKIIIKETKRQQKAKKILATSPPSDVRQLGKLKKIAAGRDLVNKVKTEINWHNGGVYLIESALKLKNLLNLIELVKDVPVLGQNATEFLESLKDRDSQTKKQLGELQGQIRTITSSEYGKWLKTGKDRKSINLFELSQKPGTVVLFSLNSDSEPEFAKFLGALILANITNVSAKRRNMGIDNLVNVYIDEFQTLQPSSVKSILEKSRESKMAVTLAQQALEQIIESAERNGQALLDSILNTCSNFIVHAGSKLTSAEALAGLIGKDTTLDYNFSSNDDYRQKEVEDWIFSPSNFMKLKMPSEANGFKTTAVIINKSSSDPRFQGKDGAVVRKVWMIPDKDVLKKYYDNSFMKKRIQEKGEDESFLSGFEQDLNINDDDEIVIYEDELVKENMDDDGGFEFNVEEKSKEESFHNDFSSVKSPNLQSDSRSLFKAGSDYKPKTRKTKTPENRSSPQLKKLDDDEITFPDF